MAPVNQLGVLAFASAVLAVPHAGQPFKRHAHAHPGAPPAYQSSAVYGASSAEPVWSSAAPSYSSGSWGSSAAAVSGSSWSAPAYPSGSSAAAVSGSSWVSAPPYPSASGSSGWGYSTGGYGTGYSSWGTGYSSYAPTGYSTCVETSTLIYRSTTLYSTYTITHTDYVSASASSVAPASESGWGSVPAKFPAGPTGASCVPDVTVTETVQTTVYVTPGAYSGAAPSYPAGSSIAAVSSAAAPSYGAGGWSAPAAPSSAAAAPSYPAGSSVAAVSSAAAPSYSAPAGGAPGGGAAGTLGKRGLAYNDANLANALGGSKAGGWAYNWLSDSFGLDSSIPYIPMLWGPSSDFTGTWQANAQKGIAAGAQYLFSFNEADMATQSNLTPEAAAAAWKQYMEPFAGQAKLVAPSVTNSQDANGGLNWLSTLR